MRYSNTTLKELTTRYKHVLLKCAYLNAAIIAGAMIATPVNAAITVAAGASGSLTENVSGAFSPNGGVANNNGTLTVSNDLIFDKNAANNGGVIYSANASGANQYSTLNIGNNVKFNNNTASDNIPDQAGANGSGGAIYVLGGANSSTMMAGTDVSFSGNQAVKGGALFIEDGNVTFGEGAKFENNKAGKSGGAIYNWDYLAKNTELKFGKNALFSGNSAGTVGGAIVNYDGKVTFGEGAKFENNSAGTDGGALANIKVDGVHAPTMVIAKDSSFKGNSAGNMGGAIYNEGILDIGNNVSFENNKAGYQAGAIYNNGGTVTIGDEAAFKNNTAGVIGAIFNGANGTMKIGKDSLFDGNTATLAGGTAGAINNQDSTLTIDSGAKFKNNSAIFGGGAIYNETQSSSATSSVTVGAGAEFSNNTSGSGGAIYQYGAGGMNNTTIDLGENTKFLNNRSLTQNGTRSGNGGAIMNYDGIVTIATGAEFTGNAAQGNGGAIWNKGNLTLAGSTFEGNSATQGGAIYHEGGDLTFSGDNKFSNNTAAGIANDIFNGKNGTITNNGEMFLNSGLVNNGTFNNASKLNLNGINEINSVITNTGGTIAFGDGSSLKTSLMDGTAMITGGTVSGNTSLVIANGTDTASVKIDSDVTGFKFKDNSLYDITAGADGTYDISKKSLSQMTEALTSQGVGATEAITIGGVTGAKPTNATAQAFADAMTAAAQTGDMATASKLAAAVNPDSTPVVQTQAVGTATQVMNVASDRMSSAGEGRSGGSLADFAYGPWVQGLYNKTHNSQGTGFNGYSQGFAAGIDVDVTDSTMLGVAYAYTATDIKSSGRTTNVYGDNYMIYGKYQPNNWYVDGSFNYGRGSYHENSLGLKSKYNVDTYGGQALVGYQDGLFDNYAGARYVYVTPEKYSNGLTEINAKNSQVGTAIIGTKISKEYKCQGVVWKPEFRLAVTYDLKSDNSSSNVSIVGGNTTYMVQGKRLSRGAIQPGLGLKATVNNLDVILGYDAEFRSEQTSQTGTLKLQYNF